MRRFSKTMAFSLLCLPAMANAQTAITSLPNEKYQKLFRNANACAARNSVESSSYCQGMLQGIAYQKEWQRRNASQAAGSSGQVSALGWAVPSYPSAGIPGYPTPGTASSQGFRDWLEAQGLDQDIIDGLMQNLPVNPVTPHWIPQNSNAPYVQGYGNGSAFGYPSTPLEVDPQ